MPVAGTHGLRIVGVAGQVAKPAQLALCVVPHSAGLIAIVLMGWIQLACKAETGKRQRIGDEVLHVCVGIGAGLVAQKCGPVGVVAYVEARLDKYASANPVPRLLCLEETLIRIPAGTKPRGIAMVNPVAVVHGDLRQLAPCGLGERLLIR